MARASRASIQRSATDSDRRLVSRGVDRVRRDEGRRTISRNLKRRGRQRDPLRRVIYITPVVWDEVASAQPWVCGDFTIAYTTTVSARGVAFNHDRPLLSRHAIATFDLLDEDPVSLLIELEWSRCRPDHTYYSGGRLIAAARTPELLFHPVHQNPAPVR